MQSFRKYFESIVVSNQPDIVDTKGDYSILSRGIDDPGSVKKFTDLESVVRFVRPRDMGPEYRRKNGLQDEYMQYVFNGFTWNDLLDGDPRDPKAKYKVHLVDMPIKLRWVHKKIPNSHAYTDAWYGYEGDDTGNDIAAFIFRDHDGKFHPAGGFSLPIYDKNSYNDLDSAVKAALGLTKQYYERSK